MESKLILLEIRCKKKKFENTALGGSQLLSSVGDIYGAVFQRHT